ncbi:hypothetical protein JQ581_20035 [Bradyrhizobium liaoningense]|uniref:hypothetical protein n=1 Tax=Bradyrhizobium liaoningense TaxID=43992 RepID=UPI001BA69506|nr:hypothetical protein [Bradyrhizobium liaoningense]MBR0739228.1 hypothetical protein [Bradyrhizobium liaoningense]
MDQIHLARALSWFSIGLGVVEFFAPRRVTATLGMKGRETMVRAFGAVSHSTPLPSCCEAMKGVIITRDFR